MRLADDDIVFTIGKETVCLRPSLRAAMRLERQYGGLDKLFASVEEDNLGTIADIIRESSVNHGELASLLDAAEHVPLHIALDTIREPVARLILAMVPHDPDKPPKASAKDKRLTFAEFFTNLYEMATGILGWTPTEAWNATPNEITVAAKSRLKFVGNILKAAFGSPDDADNDADESKNDTLDRVGLAALKADMNRGRL